MLSLVLLIVSVLDFLRLNIVFGSAYHYYRRGIEWIQQTELKDDAGSILDLFGASVSLSRNYIVVGAPNDGKLLYSCFI